MKGKILFLILFLGVFVLLLFTSVPTFIKILFTLNFLVLFIMTFYYLFKDTKYSPILASFIVFNFLFFIIAPILQTHKVYKSGDLNLSNKLIYNDYLIIKTSILVLVFNIVFFIFYRYFKAIKYHVKKFPYNKNLPFHIFFLFIISIIILIFNFEHIQNEYLFNNYSSLKGTTKSALLIKEKIILMIPFPAFILGMYYVKNVKKTKNFYIIFVITILLGLLIFGIKNPLTEKRNALGPIYITIAFLILPKLLNTNFKILIFLFFSMVIVFPTISVITHSSHSLDEMMNNPKLIYSGLKERGIVDTFTSLNYDAFTNFSATIEQVEGDQLSYGYQLSGGIFFFVPRKLWVNKPVSSGQFIGNYLRDKYGNTGSFTNLSNPFVSEGYLNFGVLGIILFAIFLAFFMARMVNWINGNNPLKIAASFYASIHLIFFLRGDFTNGYAFLLASFIVILVIPEVYFYFFKKTKIKL
jgi:hypothetical protein